MGVFSVTSVSPLCSLRSSADYCVQLNCVLCLLW